MLNTIITSNEEERVVLRYPADAVDAQSVDELLEQIDDCAEISIYGSLVKRLGSVWRFKLCTKLVNNSDLKHLQLARFLTASFPF